MTTSDRTHPTAADGRTGALVLLVNPSAGTAHDEALDAATSVWHSRGLVVQRVVLDGESDGWVDDIRPPDVDRVVIAGGDGTIHRVIAALDAADLLAHRPLGILPLGTGNDFARSAGLPLDDPAEAAEVVISGAPRSVDLLRDDHGVVVVNAAHVGLGAMAAERAQTAKSMLGAPGYAVGAVLAGASMVDYPMRVVVDDDEVSQRAERLLMVGISVGRTIGGGAPLAPSASLDDGLADVILVAATGPLQRADFARRLRDGRHLEQEDVILVRGRRIEVDAGEAPLNVDGELLGATGHRTWTLVPGSWAVLTP